MLVLGSTGGAGVADSDSSRRRRRRSDRSCGRRGWRTAARLRRPQTGKDADRTRTETVRRR